MRNAECILVDRPTLGFQHNIDSLMRNLFENTLNPERARMHCIYHVLNEIYRKCILYLSDICSVLINKSVIKFLTYLFINFLNI